MAATVSHINQPLYVALLEAGASHDKAEAAAIQLGNTQAATLAALQAGKKFASLMLTLNLASMAVQMLLLIIAVTRGH